MGFGGVNENRKIPVYLSVNEYLLVPLSASAVTEMICLAEMDCTNIYVTGGHSKKRYRYVWIMFDKKHFITFK